MIHDLCSDSSTLSAVLQDAIVMPASSQQTFEQKAPFLSSYPTACVPILYSTCYLSTLPNLYRPTLLPEHLLPRTLFEAGESSWFAVMAIDGTISLGRVDAAPKTARRILLEIGVSRRALL
jgi:hypothetical protein